MTVEVPTLVKSTFGKTVELFGFGLPTPIVCRRVEFIFIFAVICVRIGENFEELG